MRIVLFIALGAFAAPALSDTIDTVQAAIDRHRAVSLDGWSFDRVVREDDSVTRERCVGLDVRKADCRLVEMDGRAPTARELKKYARRHPGPVEDNLPNADPAIWIDLDTVVLDGHSPGAIEVSYRGAVDEGGDYEKEGAMRGVAVIEQSDPIVTSLRSANTAPFKPAPGVSVRNFVNSAAFDRVGDVVFLRSVEIRGEGRAFGLRKIDIISVVEFENFAKPD